MKIIVCIKQVPGTSKVEVDPETGVLKREGIESKLNPYDLYALETALRIREQLAPGASTVRVVTMGPPQSKEIIKEACMMGADEGVILSDQRFAGSDVLATAFTLSQGITAIWSDYDLIICGKQTTDGDTAQVGPELAEFLNIPHLTNVVGIDSVASETITVRTDLPTSLQLAEVKLPCLITVEKGIFTPRLPSYRRKVQLRHRDIPMLCLQDLQDTEESKYGLRGSPTQVERIFSPSDKSDTEMWRGDAQTLASKLYAKLVEKKFI